MATASPPVPRAGYVWAWLPGSRTAVPVGQVAAREGRFQFRYMLAYLENPVAVSLYEPELPLRRGWIPPRENMTIAGVLKDASPDSWGQRVIITRLTGTRGIAAADVELDTLTYLLESRSNRIGGLDLQSSAETYMARSSGASLLELHTAAQDLVATAGGRDVLLVRRFDRPGDGTRRMMVSAMTMLGFDDFLGARWSSESPSTYSSPTSMTTPATTPHSGTEATSN